MLLPNEGVYLQQHNQKVNTFSYKTSDPDKTIASLGALQPGYSTDQFNILDDHNILR